MIIRNPNDYKSVKKKLGLTGKNPANTYTRAGSLLLGDRALSSLNFGNELEPARQAAIRRGLSMFGPGGENELISAFRNQAYANNAMQNRYLSNAAKDAGNFAGGAMADANTIGASRDVNNYTREMYSPEYQAGRLGNYMALLGQGQDTSSLMGLAELTSLLEGIVGNQQARQQSRSGSSLLGSLLGTGAQLYGMGAFGGAGASRPKLPNNMGLRFF